MSRAPATFSIAMRYPSIDAARVAPRSRATSAIRAIFAGFSTPSAKIESVNQVARGASARSLLLARRDLEAAPQLHRAAGARVATCGGRARAREQDRKSVV